MTDRPILFSAPMVRALLKGRKTQTRRLLRIVGVDGKRYTITSGAEEAISLEDGADIRRGEFQYLSTGALSGPHPIGYAVGDRLWVRETWTINPTGGARGGGLAPFDFYELSYRADDARIELEYSGPIEDDPYVRYYDRRVGDWWPSIFMARWMSRLTLTVTDVRVERLQDISDADAILEGCPGIPGTGPAKPVNPGTSPRNQFRELWDGLNSRHAGASWSENPWVVAITFSVAVRNIDALQKEAA